MLNGSIQSAIILIHLNPSLTSMIYLLAVSPFESGFTGWGHHCYTDIPWYTDHPSLVHGTPTRSHTDQSIESLLPHEWFSHLHPHCESSNYGNPIEVIWTASWFIHVLSLSTVSIFLSHFPQFFHHFSVPEAAELPKVAVVCSVVIACRAATWAQLSGEAFGTPAIKMPRSHHCRNLKWWRWSGRECGILWKLRNTEL